jgi:hypothetical protein
MRGHNPVGWAATMLIAVAYAHVLLELAAAVLAVAVAVRLVLLAPARDLLCGRPRRCGLPGRHRCEAVLIDRRPATTARGRDRAGA